MEDWHKGTWARTAAALDLVIKSEEEDVTWGAVDVYFSVAWILKRRVVAKLRFEETEQMEFAT